MKYVGSKNKYAKELLPIILKNRKPGQWYVEPMCGGCNLIDKVENPRIANDAHPYLIPLLKYVADGGELVDTVTETLYKKVINEPEIFVDWFVGFVGFGCSFGSKWRGGYARNIRKDAPNAEENLTVRSYAAASARNLLAQAPNLKGIHFENTTYDKLSIPPESIIYFDPPYKGTTSYKGVSAFDHDAFWDFARQCWVQGHTVFISEYNAPPDFVCVWEKKVVSNLHTDRAVNKYESEKLFTYAL